MSERKSEVYHWLLSISNGLGLERLAEDFESRGFRNVSSLKYVRASDLDVLFPSPHKLMMAEKRILETELEQLKKNGKSEKPTTLLPRELFASSTQTCSPPGSSAPSNLVLFNNVHFVSKSSVGASNQKEIAEEKKVPQVANQTNSYLQRREEDLNQDNEVLAAQMQSASNLLTEKMRAFDSYETGTTGGQKLCSLCHLAGHNKNKCTNGPCKGIDFCQYRDKHPEVRAEIQELKKVLKDLEKRNEKRKMNLTYSRLQERGRQVVSLQ